jgi:hypothetical protein
VCLRRPRRKFFHQPLPLVFPAPLRIAVFAVSMVTIDGVLQNLMERGQTFLPWHRDGRPLSLLMPVRNQLVRQPRKQVGAIDPFDFAQARLSIARSVP